MSFTCPQCGNLTSLEIRQSIALPADSRSDEIALQVIECRSCGMAGIAVYEESRRGAMDHEVYDHTGYHAAAADLQAIREAIDTCPAPQDEDCTCLTHRRLGAQDADGRWAGPGFTVGDAFVMTYIPD